MAQKDKNLVLVDCEAEVVHYAFTIVLLVKVSYHKSTIVFLVAELGHLKLAIADQLHLCVLQNDVIEING